MEWYCGPQPAALGAGGSFRFIFSLFFLFCSPPLGPRSHLSGQPDPASQPALSTALKVGAFSRAILFLFFLFFFFQHSITLSHHS